MQGIAKNVRILRHKGKTAEEVAGWRSLMWQRKVDYKNVLDY